MKKLSKLMLIELERKELSQREMKHVKGGNTCGCACCYAGGGGGSSINDNGGANCSGSMYSPCGTMETTYWIPC
jgi:natural product precursor